MDTVGWRGYSSSSSDLLLFFLAFLLSVAWITSAEVKNRVLLICFSLWLAWGGGVALAGLRDLVSLVFGLLLLVLAVPAG